MNGRLQRIGMACAVLAALIALPWAGEVVFRPASGHDAENDTPATPLARTGDDGSVAWSVQAGEGDTTGASVSAGGQETRPAPAEAGGADADVDVEQSETGYFGLPSHYAPEGDIAMALFERLTNVPQQSALPEGFVDEVFNPVGLDGLRVFGAPGVVGLSWENPAQDVEGQLASALAEGGWERTGATEAATSYLKHNGSYRWLSLQVAQNAGFASAVFAYERLGEATWSN